MVHVISCWFFYAQYNKHKHNTQNLNKNTRKFFSKMVNLAFIKDWNKNKKYTVDTLDCKKVAKKMEKLNTNIFTQGMKIWKNVDFF